MQYIFNTMCKVLEIKGWVERKGDEWSEGQGAESRVKRELGSGSDVPNVTIDVVRWSRRGQVGAMWGEGRRACVPSDGFC